MDFDTVPNSISVIILIRCVDFRVNLMHTIGQSGVVLVGSLRRFKQCIPLVDDA